LRYGQNALKVNANVINPILAANQIAGYYGTIHPGKHVIVHQIDLAKRSPHFSDLSHQSSRERGKGDVPLFEIHSFLAKGDEEISPGIWVNNGLQTQF